MRPDLLQLFYWLRADPERPLRGVQTLHRESIVSSPLDQTFEFFSNAANLERLTPPWLNFRIRTPLPIAMGEGAIIDYLIGLYGVPIPWRTRIDIWEPGVRFVDRQVAGPYRWWHHEHRFEAVPGGTRVIDHVEYVPRVAALSSWLVTRDVGRIFAYRQQVLPSMLAATRDTILQA
jgi:ligand-binding SRPBCC domain-containing protein